MGVCSSHHYPLPPLSPFISTPFSHPLTQNQLRIFSAYFTHKRYSAKETIFNSGDKADSLYIIVKGSAKIYVNQTYLCQKGEGDIINTLNIEQQNQKLLSNHLYQSNGLNSSSSPSSHIFLSHLCSCIASTNISILIISYLKWKEYATNNPEPATLLLPLLISPFKALSSLSFFSSIPSIYLHTLCSYMLKQHVLTINQVLFEEGSLGSSLYILQQGSLKAIATIDKKDDNLNDKIISPKSNRSKNQSKLSNPNSPTQSSNQINFEENVKVLHIFKDSEQSDRIFGEIALIMDIPRTASIISITSNCILLEWKRDDYKAFIQLIGGMDEGLSSMMKIRTAEHFRKYKVPFFESIPEDKYAVLAELCKIDSYDAGKVIFKEGDRGNSFYIIAYGTVRVTAKKKKKLLSQEEITDQCKNGNGTGIETSLTLQPLIEEEEFEICRMGPGKYFGEIALVQDTLRTATITTVTRCIILSITKSNFELFFHQAPEAIADFEIKLARYDVQLRSVLYHQVGLNYFMQHLKREYATESVEFWLKCREYRHVYRNIDRVNENNIKKIGLEYRNHYSSREIRDEERRISRGKRVRNMKNFHQGEEEEKEEAAIAPLAPTNTVTDLDSIVLKENSVLSLNSIRGSYHHTPTNSNLFNQPNSPPVHSRLLQENIPALKNNFTPEETIILSINDDYIDSVEDARYSIFIHNYIIHNKHINNLVANLESTYSIFQSSLDNSDMIMNHLTIQQFQELLHLFNLHISDNMLDEIIVRLAERDGLIQFDSLIHFTSNIVTSSLADIEMVNDDIYDLNIQIKRLFKKWLYLILTIDVYHCRAEYVSHLRPDVVDGLDLESFSNALNNLMIELEEDELIHNYNCLISLSTNEPPQFSFDLFIKFMINYQKKRYEDYFELLDLANSIYREYISANADKQVNIKGITRNSIQNVINRQNDLIINKLINEKSSDSSIVLHTSVDKETELSHSDWLAIKKEEVTTLFELSLNLFDLAEEEILLLLESDSFNRFKQSELFQLFLVHVSSYTHVKKVTEKEKEEESKINNDKNNNNPRNKENVETNQIKFNTKMENYSITTEYQDEKKNPSIIVLEDKEQDNNTGSPIIITPISPRASVLQTEEKTSPDEGRQSFKSTPSVRSGSIIKAYTPRTKGKNLQIQTNINNHTGNDKSPISRGSYASSLLGSSYSESRSGSFLNVDTIGNSKKRFTGASPRPEIADKRKSLVGDKGI